MTPEERSLLERTAALTEENNKMLRSIRRSGRISLGMRIAYWVIILLLSFGAYWAIQPFVQSMTSILNDGSANTPDSDSSLQERIDLFKSLL
jgi:hypothetical protein